jgi:hypothetical protein
MSLRTTTLVEKSTIFEQHAYLHGTIRDGGTVRGVGVRTEALQLAVLPRDGVVRGVTQSSAH